jgi:hypothetical protein
LRAVDALSEAAPRELLTVLTATPGSRDLSIAAISPLVRFFRVEWPTARFPREYVQFGRRVTFYDGIPLLVSDFLSDVETIASGRFSAKTGGATTSMFAFRFGEDGVAGLTNGGVSVVDIGELETKDAFRYRIRWYVGLAFFHALAFARLDGITSAAVVA